MGWMIRTELARLGFSSEIRGVASLDGNIVKVLQSAGETQVARRLNQNEREFLMESLLVMNGNEIPEMKPADAHEHNVTIIMPSKFVEPAVKQRYPFDPMYKIRDSGIDRFVEKVEVHNALLHIVLEWYKEYDQPFQWSDYPTLLERRDDRLAENATDSFLERHFEITGRREDQVDRSLVSKVIKGHMNFDSFDRELSKLLKEKLRVGTLPFPIICRPGSGKNRPRLYCGLRHKGLDQDNFPTGTTAGAGVGGAYASGFIPPSND
jgi:hypothetical protein